MPQNTQEAVINNESLVIELESRLDLVTEEARTILEDAIDRIKNIGKYVSEFLKRGTILQMEPNSEFLINEANIRKSLEKVIQREKDRGNTLEVSIDNNIWNGDALKGRTMPAIETPFNAAIHRFNQIVTHKKIHEEADKLSVSKDWDISEAWNIIIAGILAGEVDVKNTGIFACFTIKMDGEDVLYRFHAFRHGGGKLHVRVFRVFQVDEWNAGNGVALSN